MAAAGLTTRTAPYAAAVKWRELPVTSNSAEPATAVARHTSSDGSTRPKLTSRGTTRTGHPLGDFAEPDEHLATPPRVLRPRDHAVILGQYRRRQHDGMGRHRRVDHPAADAIDVADPDQDVAV